MTKIIGFTRMIDFKGMTSNLPSRSCEGHSQFDFSVSRVLETIRPMSRIITNLISVSLEIAYCAKYVPNKKEQ